MTRAFGCWLIALLGAAFVGASGIALGQMRDLRAVAVVDLPIEARNTLALIKKGGPYPYKKDGTVFGNFEKRLPAHERGYYHEFTVPTPGSRDRGARRIVTGKAGEYYYTDDHYKSFKRVRE
jgi:ribonuclease T1